MRNKMVLPPLYALRAFEAAERFGSFSKAAAYLNLSPSAISRHICTLEDWFECKLFIRKGPKVESTDIGKVLAKQLADGFRCIEHACNTLQSNSRELRLKAPSTLTMRWLLEVLKSFNELYSTPKVGITSVWMDVDSVDFSNEPYDCAILLGHGQFGPETDCLALFDEFLIPICSPKLTHQVLSNIAEFELIHPSPDRRDWRRWLKKTGRHSDLNISYGKVFDTLEQGNLATMSGHGVSIGDLLLSLESINSGLLDIPYREAVATGDSYYLVWPKNSLCKDNIEVLHHWLRDRIPSELPKGVKILR